MMANYATPKQAIEAASKLQSGDGTGLIGDDTVRYVADGKGGVTRVEHYCNVASSGRAKTTHRERIVRLGQE